MLPRIPGGAQRRPRRRHPLALHRGIGPPQLRQRPRVEPGRVRGVDRRHALPPADGPGRGL